MSAEAAYSPLAWQGFLAAAAGAAAALTGLLFAAVSINLERILSFAKLPAPVAGTPSVLLLVLVIAGLGLAPQPRGALAAEMTGCADSMPITAGSCNGGTAPATPATRPGGSPPARPPPAAVGAVRGRRDHLAARHGGGLYQVLPATLTGFPGAGLPRRPGVQPPRRRSWS